VKLISGADEVDLVNAAAKVGVRVDLRGGGRFGLKTDGGIKTNKKHPKYRKIGRYGRTVPGAVCWHGHRDFFRELFELKPEAVIETALATYKGAEHFEDTYRDTRWGSGGRGSFVGTLGQQECDCWGTGEAE